MTFRDSHIHMTVLGVTALFAVLSMISFESLAAVQYALLVAGTVAIGIPHGATDNFLYARLVSEVRTTRFYLIYLAVAVLYGALWLVAPVFSLLLFLLISVYHFGQSNLFYTDIPEGKGVKKLVYLPWGAFNLATPILFRYEEAAPIIEYLIGFSPLTVESATGAAPYVAGGLLAVNGVILIVLYARARILAGDLVREFVAFALLSVLYINAPLFVSFIVYWVFWHSLNAALEIASVQGGRRPIEQTLQFYRSALPLTAVTLAGMALIFLLAGVYGSLEALIGTFFVIIAAITLPHTVIMELLYRSFDRA
ncbi:MAG: Brp/Blh family beta-carotene 15,15'-dioxygenase [bacterium]